MKQFYATLALCLLILSIVMLTIARSLPSLSHITTSLTLPPESTTGQLCINIPDLSYQCFDNTSDLFFTLSSGTVNIEPATLPFEFGLTTYQSQYTPAPGTFEPTPFADGSTLDATMRSMSIEEFLTQTSHSTHSATVDPSIIPTGTPGQFCTNMPDLSYQCFNNTSDFFFALSDGRVTIEPENLPYMYGIATYIAQYTPPPGTFEPTPFADGSTLDATMRSMSIEEFLTQTSHSTHSATVDPSTIPTGTPGPHCTVLPSGSFQCFDTPADLVFAISNGRVVIEPADLPLIPALATYAAQITPQPVTFVPTAYPTFNGTSQPDAPFPDPNFAPTDSGDQHCTVLPDDTFQCFDSPADLIFALSGGRVIIEPPNLWHPLAMATYMAQVTPPAVTFTLTPDDILNGTPQPEYAPFSPIEVTNTPTPDS